MNKQNENWSQVKSSLFLVPHGEAGGINLGTLRNKNSSELIVREVTA